MSKPKTTRFTIDLAADLADAVTRAAVAGNIPTDEFISECVKIVRLSRTGWNSRSYRS
jgi:hypothetical protein